MWKKKGRIEKISVEEKRRYMWMRMGKKAQKYSMVRPKEWRKLIQKVLVDVWRNG